MLQIQMRPVLLKTIKNLSKEHGMSNVCVHLAVLLLDFFMDNHCLKFDTILLVTFACLTIAGECNFDITYTRLFENKIYGIVILNIILNS